MRIEVDRDRCEGYGMCEAMASDVFELDDDEVVHVLDASPPESSRTHVHAAVQACPVLALALTD